MIFIQRPALEPPDLARVRAQRLPDVTTLPGATGPLQTRQERGRLGVPVHQPQNLIKTDSIDGYQVARQSLFEAQYKKCCYCERKPEEKWQDTEHFRPKAAYWWLAWTWENLLFGCKNCNTPKLAYFPLQNPACLQPPPAQPVAERPLLIDPADPRVDPITHIRFHHEGDFHWRPLPRAGSRRGAEMIQTCQLARPPLLDQYSDAAEGFEDSRIRIQDAIDSGDGDRITRTWEEICFRRLSPRVPFTALYHDMLDRWFPPLIRARHKLELRIVYPFGPPAPP